MDKPNKNIYRFPNISRSDLTFEESGSIYENINKNDTNEYSKKEYQSERNQSLALILKEIKKITKKVTSDEDNEERSLDWKFAAMVIDRLCLVIFSLATFISTALTVFTSKNFFKFR